jgi:predicted dienelactone hydrolase
MSSRASSAFLDHAGSRAGVVRWCRCVVLFMVAGCAGVPPSLSAPEQHVGATSRTVVDEERGRTFTYEIFYPASNDSTEEVELHAWIYALPLARDAAFAGGEGHPLIVTSHGTGGSRWDFFWLAQALTAQGFIVVSVEHPGDNWEGQDPFTSLQVWERPRDVSAALDDVLRDPSWGPRIDPERIAAAGHSVGGFTVLGLAGLRYDIDRAFVECMNRRMNDTTCIWVRQTTFDFRRIDYGRSKGALRDPRVKAVFAMSPAVAEAADVDAARHIAIPVHIVGSRRDGLTPFELHAARYAEWIGTSTLTELQLGNHYVAVSPCNGFGRRFITPCQDVDGFDRVGAQRRLAHTAEQFFLNAFDAPVP